MKITKIYKKKLEDVIKLTETCLKIHLWNTLLVSVYHNG